SLVLSEPPGATLPASKATVLVPGGRAATSRPLCRSHRRAPPSMPATRKRPSGLMSPLLVYGAPAAALLARVRYSRVGVTSSNSALSPCQVTPSRRPSALKWGAPTEVKRISGRPEEGSHKNNRPSQPCEASSSPSG